MKFMRVMRGVFMVFGLIGAACDDWAYAAYSIAFAVLCGQFASEEK
jgi:hypothetical protein